MYCQCKIIMHPIMYLLHHSLNVTCVYKNNMSLKMVYNKVHTDDQLNSIILTHQITILKLIYIFGKTIEKARCIP
jgi:hypothetical protein